jgi:hypothetical protein
MPRSRDGSGSTHPFPRPEGSGAEWGRPAGSGSAQRGLPLGPPTDAIERVRRCAGLPSGPYRVPVLQDLAGPARNFEGRRKLRGRRH